jgi:hypothetical protein
MTEFVGVEPPTRALPRFPIWSIPICGNVGGSPTPGNHTAETALAGWGGRIRTSIWRNQNPLHLTISLWQPAPSACQEKGARYPQRFASHWIVRSGQTQLKRAAHQLQAPTSLVTRWNLPQAPK